MTVGELTADGRARVLADGNQMPVLGLGVWQVPAGAACVNAVRWALDLGYRHIDTAQAYGNEESVGRALRDSGVPRDEVFITTKFHPAHQDPVAEAEQSLRRLGVDQVDLYLVHWPQGGPSGPGRGWSGLASGAWPARSACPTSARTDLAAVLAVGTIPPAVNQVQFSPSAVPARPARARAVSADVLVEAYSPLGTGRHLTNRRCSRSRSGSAGRRAQVLLRWCLQHDLLVIPKSTHQERIRENAQIFDFTLSPADMAELDALDRTKGTGQARERHIWRGALRRARAVMPIRRTS